MNILLGMTGSVAAKLHKKIRESLKTDDSFIQTIATESAYKAMGEKYLEECEWDFYKTTGKIAHIEYRNWADVLVVAPLTANTMAKFANGLCDNLLTNIFRAWDFSKPVIMCPAMNTYMYEHPITKHHMNFLSQIGVKFIDPQVKTLACGDTGTGAMCEIEKIKQRLKWIK